MENINMQQQIDALSHKIDMVLEMLEKQQERNTVVDDLVEDLSIVGKDAFQTAVDELSIQNIKIDGDDVKYLIFKLIGNIKTFGELMDTLESVMDFMKDIGPVIHDAGISITKSLDKLERNGYFSYIKQLSLLVGDVKANITEADIENIRKNMPSIGNIIRNLTHPETINTLVQLSTMKIDDSIDKKSIFKIIRELNKPEARKTLSFLVRIMNVLGKQ
ncbi:MAG TPA: hypothetical protein PLA24_05475 [Tenuifilaceae bacterium]|nr:hypothetical protein [Tenuifilaceae bacterium]